MIFLRDPGLPFVSLTAFAATVPLSIEVKLLLALCFECRTPAKAAAQCLVP